MPSPDSATESFSRTGRDFHEIEPVKSLSVVRPACISWGRGRPATQREGGLTMVLQSRLRRATRPWLAAGRQCASSEWHRTPPWGKVTKEESR
jgi:hypothetical protein